MIYVNSGTTEQEFGKNDFYNEKKFSLRHMCETQMFDLNNIKFKDKLKIERRTYIVDVNYFKTQDPISCVHIAFETLFRDLI